MAVYDVSLRIVHLSDLHIHEPLSSKGRRLILGQKSHVFNHLAAARRAILKENVLNPSLQTTYCVTGDITTNASTEAFRLGRSFLRDIEVVSNGVKHTVGLGATSSGYETVVVPGNHDRYWKVQLGYDGVSFEQAFHGLIGIMPGSADQPFERLPSGAKYMPHIRVVRCGGSNSVACVFFCIDSNDLTPLEKLNPLTKIACGRVSEESLSWLRSSVSKLNSDNQVVDCFGATESLVECRVLKILVLHHHPIVPEGEKYSGRTVLLNNDAVKSIASILGIDMVVFGHEHRAFVSAKLDGAMTTSPLYFCAPSLSVFGAEEPNGFALIDVSDRTILWRLFRENDGVFLEADQKHFDLGLSDQQD